MVPTEGIEPPTYWLQVSCATSCAKSAWHPSLSSRVLLLGHIFFCFLIIATLRLWRTMKPRSSYVPFHRIGYLHRVSLISLLTQRTLYRVSVIIYRQRPRLLLFQYKLVGHPLVLTGSIVRIITNESCHILLCEVGNIRSLWTVLLSSIALSYNYIKRLALISKSNGFLIRSAETVSFHGQS